MTDANDEPLGVFTLRGAIPKDDGWTRTPGSTTGDRIDGGSDWLATPHPRLWRGPGNAPVHAGLAGNDILILLDEVHLSQPFKQTLERLGKLRYRFLQNGLPRRFQFAFLSATPGEVIEDRFPGTPEVIEADPMLRPRLHAKKPAQD